MTQPADPSELLTTPRTARHSPETKTVERREGPVRRVRLGHGLSEAVRAIERRVREACAVGDEALSPRQSERLSAAWRLARARELRLAVIGCTGVGKTSLVQALAGRELGLPRGRAGVTRCATDVVLGGAASPPARGVRAMLGAGVDAGRARAALVRTLGADDGALRWATDGDVVSAAWAGVLDARHGEAGDVGEALAGVARVEWRLDGVGVDHPVRLMDAPSPSVVGHHAAGASADDADAVVLITPAHRPLGRGDRVQLRALEQAMPGGVARRLVVLVGWMDGVRGLDIAGAADAVASLERQVRQGLVSMLGASAGAVPVIVGSTRWAELAAVGRQPGAAEALAQDDTLRALAESKGLVTGGEWGPYAATPKAFVSALASVARGASGVLALRAALDEVATRVALDEALRPARVAAARVLGEAATQAEAAGARAQREASEMSAQVAKLRAGVAQLRERQQRVSGWTAEMERAAAEGVALIRRGTDAALTLLGEALRDTARSFARREAEALRQGEPGRRDGKAWRVPLEPLRQRLEAAFEVRYQEVAAELSEVQEEVRATLQALCSDLQGGPALSATVIHPPMADGTVNSMALASHAVLDLASGMRRWMTSRKTVEDAAHALQDAILRAADRAIGQQLAAARLALEGSCEETAKRLAGAVRVSLNAAEAQCRGDREQQAAALGDLDPHEVIRLSGRRRAVAEAHLSRAAHLESLSRRLGDVHPQGPSPLAAHGHALQGVSELPRA